MLSAHWILIWSFLLKDGHKVDYTKTLVKKEYCLQEARTRWIEYYQANQDNVQTFTVMCRNKDSNYEFVNVVCDRSGACNA